jgi:hypothetical protein
MLSTAQKQTIAEFEDATVDLSTFDHAAHVHVTWLYLRQCESGELRRDQVLVKVGEGLQALTRRAEVPEKYSQSITQDFVDRISEAFDKNPGADFQEFEECWPLLFQYSHS